MTHFSVFDNLMTSGFGSIQIDHCDLNEEELLVAHDLLVHQSGAWSLNCEHTVSISDLVDLYNFNNDRIMKIVDSIGNMRVVNESSGGRVLSPLTDKLNIKDNEITIQVSAAFRMSLIYADKKKPN
ncbi:MAG: hypothetical protein QM500_08720 [Methylococcales bacterium]